MKKWEGNKMRKTYLYLECKKCGHVIWSKNTAEIEDIATLQEANVYECPKCKGKKFIFAMRGVIANDG